MSANIATQDTPSAANSIDFSDHPLVETSWLVRHLDDADLRIVDSRCLGEGDCHQIYLAGHISNAVRICWHMHLSHIENGIRYLIPPPDQFAAVMAAAGSGAGTRFMGRCSVDRRPFDGLRTSLHRWSGAEHKMINIRQPIALTTDSLGNAGETDFRLAQSCLIISLTSAYSSRREFIARRGESK